MSNQEHTIRKLKIHPDFPYVYETHLHTREASACARCTGQEMARACHEAGYTGIIVTDHFFYGNTRVDRSLPWSEWVEGFCSGYEHAKAEGDRIGLQVFFGWEAAYEGTEFLINGLSKEWLLAHPEVKDCTIPEQLELVHEGGGIVVQAHPFREEGYIPWTKVCYKHVDAMEAVNATHSCVYSGAHNDPFFDALALMFIQHHHLPRTAGSDVHGTDLLLGGMAFARRLEDSADYCRAVLGKEPCLLLNGNESAAGAEYRAAYEEQE